MVNAAWQQLLDEIARWRDAGLAVEFWWRDDDAQRPDPALARLMSLADSYGVALALAVVPEGVQAAAFEPASAMVCVLQHGVDHRNRAAAGAKKTEFPEHEGLPLALARLMHGRAQLEALDGVSVLPVLVPPWNRISAPGLAGLLAGAGYRGLSTFGARRSREVQPGLVCANTHVDIIDWHGSRGFKGADSALAQATRHLRMRRTGVSDSTEPTGWLTHHALHDGPAWMFLEQLLERTRGLDGVRWLGAAEIFGRRGTP